MAATAMAQSNFPAPPAPQPPELENDEPVELEDNIWERASAGSVRTMRPAGALQLANTAGLGLFSVRYQSVQLPLMCTALLLDLDSDAAGDDAATQGLDRSPGSRG